MPNELQSIDNLFQCSNLESTIDWCNQLGTLFNINVLIKLKVENLTNTLICESEDKETSKWKCLSSQSYSHCFKHVAFKQKCDDCNHKCKQNFADFLDDALSDVDKEELNAANVPFPHFAKPSKDDLNPRFTPKTHKASQVDFPVGRTMAIQFVQDGLFHYQERRDNTEAMRSIRNQELEDDEIILEFDYANPFKLLASRNAQSEFIGPAVHSLTAICYYVDNGKRNKLVFHGLASTKKERGQILYMEQKILVRMRFSARSY